MCLVTIFAAKNHPELAWQKRGLGWDRWVGLVQTWIKHEKGAGRDTRA